MTRPRVIINSLKDMEATLERFRFSFKQSSSSADSFAAGARHALDRCRLKLEYELDFARRELEKAQRDLDDCERQIIVDQYGYRIEPDCRRQEINLQGCKVAVQNLEQKLGKLKFLDSAFDSALRGYQAELQRMNAAVERTISQAQDFIRRRREALELFEAFAAISVVVTGVLGAISALTNLKSRFGGHSYGFQKARQQFLHSRVTDPNEPRFVRGWIQQELNRLEARQSAQRSGLRPPGGGNQIRGIPGYDVGHRIPGIDLPENFRLENRSVNRARPGIARRLGIENYR